MKFFPLAAIAVLLSLASGGCGGATTASTQRTDGATFALSSGQKAPLSIITQGNLVGGTLLVPVTTATTTNTFGSLSFALPPGNYGFNGILASDRTFQATGNVPSVSQFTLSGQLGTGTASGNFLLIINGQRVAGAIVRQ